VALALIIIPNLLQALEPLSGIDLAGTTRSVAAGDVCWLFDIMLGKE
jgi:hypothetical protein